MSTITHEVTDKQLDELIALKGNKVAEIKKVREITGASLRASKSWVESDYQDGFEIEEREGMVTTFVLGTDASLDRLISLLTKVADIAIVLRKKGVI